MSALIAFWTHALAASLFATLTLWQARAGARHPGQRLLLASYALTACWAWLGALALGGALVPLAETARNLGWVALLYGLSDFDGETGQRQRAVRLVYGAVAAVLGLQFIADGLPLLISLGRAEPTAAIAALGLRTIAAAGALVLVHNLYGKIGAGGLTSLRLSMIALALMWTYDLLLYSVAHFDGQSFSTLNGWRGAAVALSAPLLALGARRSGNWRIRLSRAATFQSLSLLAICGYFGVMTVLATAMRSAGWDWARVAAIGALAVMTIAAMVLVPSRRARNWATVKIAKHLFEHRYDYRSEWLRFTETLGRVGADAAPLGERVIRAFADIVDAPAGLLLVAGDTGHIELAAAWNWPDPFVADGDVDSDRVFWTSLEANGRIVELDAHRQARGFERDRDLVVPEWMIRDADAWAAVPLLHHGRLVGIVLLAGPEYRRALDWEDFDLLRTAGRQAASSLAEAHGQQALSNAQRFEEFNRRFAFILHDIKNLVSQLSLLSRNAERHADNAEFRADMVATLKSSVGKMNDLLARLAPHGALRNERATPVALDDLLDEVVGAKRRDHRIELASDGGLVALADPLQLEQALGHLLQNAIDASPADQPVLVRARRLGSWVVIEIIDCGCGMDSDFVRNRLFQPFASTKQDGFGVGAFEARALIAAMGGRLSVDSRPGRGSRFTVRLTAAPAPAATAPADPGEQPIDHPQQRKRA